MGACASGSADGPPAPWASRGCSFARPLRCPGPGAGRAVIGTRRAGRAGRWAATKLARDGRRRPGGGACRLRPRSAVWPHCALSRDLVAAHARVAIVAFPAFPEPPISPKKQSVCEVQGLAGSQIRRGEHACALMRSRSRSPVPRSRRRPRSLVAGAHHVRHARAEGGRQSSLFLRARVA